MVLCISCFAFRPILNTIMTDGRVLTGLLIEKSKTQVVLKNAKAEEIRLPIEKVNTIVSQRNSLNSKYLRAEDFLQRGWRYAVFPLPSFCEDARARRQPDLPSAPEFRAMRRQDATNGSRLGNHVRARDKSKIASASIPKSRMPINYPRPGSHARPI